MLKNKFVALVGASATGKSTVEKILEEQYGMRRCISCTTRPKRDYEVDGVHYHFVTIQDMIDMRNEGLLAEETCFNGWYYGLTHSEVEEGGVIVIEPNGLQQIIRNVGRENVFVVYLTYPDKERLIRSLVDRDDTDIDEVIRRFQADKEDMQGMENVADIVIVNHDSEVTASKIYNLLDILSEPEELKPLEAIEAMKQGHVVACEILESPFVFKIEDDVIKFKSLVYESDFRESKHFPFDKTFTVMQEA